MQTALGSLVRHVASLTHLFWSLKVGLHQPSFVALVGVVAWRYGSTTSPNPGMALFGSLDKTCVSSRFPRESSGRYARSGAMPVSQSSPKGWYICTSPRERPSAVQVP